MDHTASDAMTEMLPKALQEAMSRLLDADSDSDRSPAPPPPTKRIEVLRAARAAVRDWREGRLTAEQAVACLDALAKSVGT
jgi:hypothetical protein